MRCRQCDSLVHSSHYGQCHRCGWVTTCSGCGRVKIGPHTYVEWPVDFVLGNVSSSVCPDCIRSIYGDDIYNRVMGAN